MAEPTIQLGGGNWAGKSGNLLAYHKSNNNFYADDLTFARASTGTYTDKDGYIQEMPYNLLTYSEDFSNAAWLKTSGVTVTSNYGISPDGKQNSTRLQFASNNEQVYDGIVHSGNTETASIYVKGQSGITMQFGVGSNISQGSTYTLTGEWQRLEHQSTSGSLFIIGNKDLTATDIEIWGAQLVKGTSAKTYFPTTTRLNMPRVDYLNNSNGSLILEPQRTNLVTHSSDFSEWSTIGSPTLTSNYGQSPDGLNNSTRVQFSSGDRIYTSASLSGDISYSVYLKGNGTVRMRDNSGAYSNDVTLTNEWVRYDYTFNASISNVQLQQSSGTSDFEIYGAQVESGSYPTNLIPTTGTAVTRVSEFCNKTSISSLIGQTEGTFLLDFVYTGLYDNSLSFLTRLAEDNTSTNRIGIYSVRSNDSIRAFCNSNNVGQFDAQIGTLIVGQRYKVAMRYKINDFSIYLNGTNVYTNTSADVPLVLNDYVLGNVPNTSQFSNFCKTNQATLFKEALTDDELATLTT